MRLLLKKTFITPKEVYDKRSHCKTIKLFVSYCYHKMSTSQFTMKLTDTL